MNLESLVAIDVHTHAWKSALQLDDAPTESQAAMGRYFRYQPQHQTVPEMADLYRRLRMAFVVFTVDGEKGASRKITNEEIAELAHKNADVAIPFASINPHRGEAGVRTAIPSASRVVTSASNALPSRNERAYAGASADTTPTIPVDNPSAFLAAMAPQMPEPRPIGT